MMAHDSIDIARFRWERAYEEALRVIQLFGDHWSNCGLRKRNPVPCDCGFLRARRELIELAKVARQ